METYDPRVFVPDSIEHAKSIILSTDPTGEKWVQETEETVTNLLAAFESQGRQLTSASVLVDYGAGIGRVAKRLIERIGCSVIAVDFSPRMLQFGIEYVQSDHYVPCSAGALARLVRSGLRVDGAYAVWTLQHCLEPERDIAFIRDALADEAYLYVVNKRARYVPVTPEDGWARWCDDGIDIEALLSRMLLRVGQQPCHPSDFRGLFQKKTGAGPPEPLPRPLLRT